MTDEALIEFLIIHFAGWIPAIAGGVLGTLISIYLIMRLSDFLRIFTDA